MRWKRFHESTHTMKLEHMSTYMEDPFWFRKDFTAPLFSPR